MLYSVIYNKLSSKLRQAFVRLYRLQEQEAICS